MTKNRDDIEKVTKEFEEFSYIVSHDLKAPLRGISNITQWIEEDFGPDINQDIKDNFGLLKGRVEKLNDMIDSITEYSRINRRNLEVAEVNLTDYMDNLKLEIEQRFPNSKVLLNGDVGEVSTYSKKLTQVIQEIVENAAQHNYDKQNLVIKVDYKVEKKVLILAVEDNGKSVPEESVSNLTKLFYTMVPKDKSKTTGAGLTIVEKIVDFVEGNLEILVQENKFKVIISWPLN